MFDRLPLFAIIPAPGHKVRIKRDGGETRRISRISGNVGSLQEQEPRMWMWMWMWIVDVLRRTASSIEG